MSGGCFIINLLVFLKVNKRKEFGLNPCELPTRSTKELPQLSNDNDDVIYLKKDKNYEI